ncbi:hypothetical protein [Microcoleus sp. FACHB-831]|nr:hypothetical protein [Microcoleus sp. FACHB-831]
MLNLRSVAARIHLHPVHSQAEEIGSDQSGAIHIFLTPLSPAEVDF